MLQIENLSKNFRGVCALNNVSLRLNKGEVIAFVGDNGAGKSTLMKCVSGALAADTGKIFFNEHDISWSDPDVCRQVGIEMIYQDLSLCRLQNVVANVFLGREVRKGIFIDRKFMSNQCQKAFADLGINIPLTAPVGNLSGGQQQSVAIARALIANPKLLIMDEPTAALASREVQRVLEQISLLKKRGVAVAMITHRLADIFEVADRIIVMSHGQVKYNLLPGETDLKDLTFRIVSE